MTAGSYRPLPARRRAVAGHRPALVGFLMQNAALGLGYGSFGPLLASTEQHFHLTRAEAATGMSLLTLGMTVVAPLAGGLLQRKSIRLLMSIGALISMIGYWGLALAPSFGLALAMYLLIGFGVCLLAILGPLTLVNRWFGADRARVLSLVNLPVVLFLAPFVVAYLLPLVGRSVLLIGIGAVFVLLIPLMAMIADDNPIRPPAIGGSATGERAPSGPDRAGPASSSGSRAILGHAPFWLLSLGIGVMAGSGVAFVVHIVPFGLGQDMSLPKASALVSIYGGSGVLGTLVFGWICDKVGSQVAVLIGATGMTLLWASLSQAAGNGLFPIAAALGIFGVPILTYHGAAISELFGPAQASRAMGFSYAVKLPFLLASAPLVGLMYQHFGGYRPAFLVITAMMAGASLLILIMLLLTRGRRNDAVLI